MSVAALKQGNMGKLIKQLSKQEHPGQPTTSTSLSKDGVPVLSCKWAADVV